MTQAYGWFGWHWQVLAGFDMHPNNGAHVLWYMWHRTRMNLPLVVIDRQEPSRQDVSNVWFREVTS